MKFKENPFDPALGNTSPPMSFPPLDFPKAPTMPTFFELVETSPTLQEPQPKGLFETLLGARLDVLHADAEEFPEKYPEETRHLLHELMAGQKSVKELKLEDQLLLDQATIDFASTPPKKREEKIKEAEAVTEEKEGLEEDEEDFFEKGAEPESELRAFWWR